MFGCGSSAAITNAGKGTQGKMAQATDENVLHAYHEIATGHQ